VEVDRVKLAPRKLNTHPADNWGGVPLIEWILRKRTGELVLKKGKANLSLVGEIGPELEHPGFSLANPE